MKFSGGTHRHRPVSKRRDDALALPKFNLSILEQPRDCACSRTKNVEPRKMNESSGPGTLNQRATCARFAHSMSDRLYGEGRAYLGSQLVAPPSPTTRLMSNSRPPSSLYTCTTSRT